MKPRPTDDQLNALTAEVTRLKEIMACGHPGACITTSVEGTNYCSACESLGGYIADADEAKARLAESNENLRERMSQCDGFVAQINQDHAKLAKTEQERDYFRQQLDRAAADVMRSEKMVASLAEVTTERDQIRAKLAVLEAQMQKKVAAPDTAMKALQEMAEGGCRCHERPCHGGCGSFVLAANVALAKAAK